MSQTPEPLAVTRHQAAQMVNISVTEIDDERRAGRLVARKHGRKVLIEVSELRRWVEALPSDDMRFAPEPDSGGVGAGRSTETAIPGYDLPTHPVKG